MSEKVSKITEDKKKKLTTSVKVGAILLAVIFLSLLVYQIIAIIKTNNDIKEYDNKIIELNELIEDGTNVKAIRETYEWIVQRAKELGKIPPDAEIIAGFSDD